jgi:tRNA pseudouridine38-40 synthase
LIISGASVYNLNAILPADIIVKGIYPVPANAHCRFDAVAREYRYYVYRQKDPFMADRGWLYSYPLNRDILQESARILMEYNDFTSFAKRNTQVKTYMCTIQASEWVEEGGNLIYRVRANRFLRGMVRGLVATMLKAGRGQLSLEEFRKVIESKNNTQADFSAPPQGLFLESVEYGEELAVLLSVSS